MQFIDCVFTSKIIRECRLLGIYSILSDHIIFSSLFCFALKGAAYNGIAILYVLYAS